MFENVKWCNACNMNMEFDGTMCETCGTFASGVAIVNLTPHPITIMNHNNEVIRNYKPSGKVARVATAQEYTGNIDGVAVKKSAFGEVSDLPDPQENTYYIVSLMVAQALSHRQDLICPDTSPSGAVRNETGGIIGSRGFQTPDHAPSGAVRNETGGIIGSRGFQTPDHAPQSNDLVTFCSGCFATNENGSWTPNGCTITEIEAGSYGYCENCSGHGRVVIIPRDAAEKIRQQASWVGKRYYPNKEDLGYEHLNANSSKGAVTVKYRLELGVRYGEGQGFQSLDQLKSRVIDFLSELTE